jgi:hypothetical protein
MRVLVCRRVGAILRPLGPLASVSQCAAEACMQQQGEGGQDRVRTSSERNEGHTTRTCK